MCDGNKPLIFYSSSICAHWTIGLVCCRNMKEQKGTSCCGNICWRCVRSGHTNNENALCWLFGSGAAARQKAIWLNGTKHSSTTYWLGCVCARLRLFNKIQLPMLMKTKRLFYGAFRKAVNGMRERERNFSTRGKHTNTYYTIEIDTPCFTGSCGHQFRLRLFS